MELFILGGFLGAILGMFLMSAINISNINELLDENHNAELRAVTHFRKLFKIEYILRKAKREKTPAVFTIDKIEEVITSDQTTNNF